MVGRFKAGFAVHSSTIVDEVLDEITEPGDEIPFVKLKDGRNVRRREARQSVAVSPDSERTGVGTISASGRAVAEVGLELAKTSGTVLPECRNHSDRGNLRYANEGGSVAVSRRHTRSRTPCDPWIDLGGEG